MNHRARNFFAAFAIVGIGSAAATAVGWVYSSDVRGWWPYGLALSWIVDAVYAGLFVAITGGRQPVRLDMACLYNAIFAAMMVVQSHVYYTEPLRANASAAPFYGIYVVFLVGAAVLAASRAGPGG